MRANLCTISGKGLVIFGGWRRVAATACGLGTEDPVMFLERGALGGGEKTEHGRPVPLQPLYDLLLD